MVELSVKKIEENSFCLVKSTSVKIFKIFVKIFCHFLQNESFLAPHQGVAKSRMVILLLFHCDWGGLDLTFMTHGGERSEHNLLLVDVDPFFNTFSMECFLNSNQVPLLVLNSKRNWLEVLSRFLHTFFLFFLGGVGVLIKISKYFCCCCEQDF